MNETEKRGKLDAYLNRHGIRHFKAIELSQPSVAYIAGKPIPNRLIPPEYWDNLVAVALLAEAIRSNFGGRPVIVNSGYRCRQYNKVVGGVRNSQHLFGRALDIRIPGIRAREIFRYMEKAYKHHFGRGLYRTFVHIDVRDQYARWIRT